MLNTTIYPDPELEVGAPAPEFFAPAVVNGEIVDKLSLADFKVTRRRAASVALRFTAAAVGANPHHSRIFAGQVCRSVLVRGHRRSWGSDRPRGPDAAVDDSQYAKYAMATRDMGTMQCRYPKDFTYVCPTEIIAFNDRAKEFEALNCQLIAASTDTPETHLAWIKTPRKRGGLGNMDIPMLSDVTKSIAARYGVLLKDAGIALRGLYIIDDGGVVQHATINNLGIGRSVDETLRTLQVLFGLVEAVKQRFFFAGVSQRDGLLWHFHDGICGKGY